MSELLRFATAGSVDDGKSTLIGRLLYDSKAIFEDQLEAVERTSRERGDEYTNLALLTDGLRAEREQGITIDVAYRYFATPKRKFIIADTPGHTQYTRNMVTGASTADLAIISSTRARACSSRAGATRSSRACSGSHTSCCASTRWTWSTGARSASTRSRPSSATSR
jgi:sulfate adenylyltransferase subunit 1 (EFTu-like GTPase family)